MTRLRMRVAERLKGAQNTYAMLTTFNEVDMSTIMNVRNKYKVSWQAWLLGKSYASAAQALPTCMGQAY